MKKFERFMNLIFAPRCASNKELETRKQTLVKIEWQPDWKAQKN